MNQTVDVDVLTGQIVSILDNERLENSKYPTIYCERNSRVPHQSSKPLKKYWPTEC